MKLVIELSPEELEAAQRDGALIVSLEAVELHQGLLIEERRISHLEALSRRWFAKPALARREQQLPEDNGPWLKVWLGPDTEEPDDGIGRTDDD